MTLAKSKIKPDVLLTCHTLTLIKVIKASDMKFVANDKLHRC